MKFFPSLRRIWFDGILFICNRVVGHLPSHALRKFFYRSVMKIEIGEKSFIFCRAHFDSRGGFRMGNHSTINEECRLDNRGGIVIDMGVHYTDILEFYLGPIDTVFGMNAIVDATRVDQQGAEYGCFGLTIEWPKR